MPILSQRNVLTGIRVAEAMRRQVITLDPTDTLDTFIRHTIKYKINALLVVDAENRPAGVVSKTDVMGAFYAGFELDTPLEMIMVGPPLFCRDTDRLESALARMHANGVHRLYVHDADENTVGTLAYPDIVGLLYRFCSKCKKNISLHQADKDDAASAVHIQAKEVMTAAVTAFSMETTLTEIMEALSMHRFGAVLITDEHEKAVGVVSKTDLMIAFRHGMAADTPARTIMNAPVRTCRTDDFIVDVIRHMIFSDMHRLFVHDGQKDRMVGVISLTDAAKVRSGSCRACTASRFLAPSQ